MICFGECVNRAREWALDSAVCVLEALRDLCQHHPALQPEVVALTAIYNGWDVLTTTPAADLPRERREARARFDAYFETIRDAKFETALEELGNLEVLIEGNPHLRDQANAINLLLGFWLMLRDGEVMRLYRSK